MTPQERDLITTLLTRLKSATGAGQAKDAEADALIDQAVSEQADAPYYLVQTVLIQDLSLHQAQNRIAELEHQLSDASAPKPAGSFLGNLFGRNQPPAPVAQQAQNPGPWNRGPQVAPPPPPPPGPGYAQQPGWGQQGYAQGGYGGGVGGGMLGGAGGGFLRSAAATAAGVAGGALLFEGISGLFGHNYASGLYGGGGGGFTPGLGETVVNNYYGDSGSGGGGGDYAGGGGDYAGGGDSSGGGDYSGGGG